jgi:hypothetical protein
MKRPDIQMDIGSFTERYFFALLLRLASCWLRHGFTRFGAAVASLGTLLAMLGIMLGAFVATRLADICAESADLAGIFATLRHEGGRQTADLCALPVQTDTFRHHFHVVFFQAGNRAGIAVSRTDMTTLDAGLIFSEVHLVSFGALTIAH